jgi:hypothetical protein
MNTLSKSITTNILNDPEAYSALRKRWSELVNSDRKHELSAAHHLLYLALCGKDWRKAFTPVTNNCKLENGAYWNWGLFHAMRIFHSRLHEGCLTEPFDGTVTPQILNQIRQIVPNAQPHKYHQDYFRSGTFPFDAYNVPETMIKTSVEEE